MTNNFFFKKNSSQDLAVPDTRGHGLFTRVHILVLTFVCVSVLLSIPREAAAGGSCGGGGGDYGEAAYYVQGTYYTQTYYQAYYQTYYQAYYQAYYQTYYEGYYQAYYQGYYQGYYQSSYYSQPTYYSQPSYYTQGYYQAAYWTPSVYTYQYELSGKCVKVTVTKSPNHPRTRIKSDGYNVTCAEIPTSARALQRTVELQY